MDIRVSDDIKTVIDWEIEHNANAIDCVSYPFGSSVVSMQRPVKQTHDGKSRDVPRSLSWWEFRSPHYAEDQWRAGFESSESGHKVCGPLR